MIFNVMSQHPLNCLRLPGGGRRTAAAAEVSAAIHECGHAIAAHTFGGTDIECWVNGNRGECSWNMPVAFSKLERIVVALSGPEAQRIYVGSADQKFWLWDDCIDVQHAMGRFMFCPDDPLFNRAYRLASALVADRWLAIRVHASKLARMKTLTL